MGNITILALMDLVPFALTILLCKPVSIVMLIWVKMMVVVFNFLALIIVL